MKAFVFVFLLLAGVARADQVMVYRTSGGAEVRLTQAACALPEIGAALLVNGAASARAATVLVGGQIWIACWGVDEDQDVLIGDEAGRAGLIPARAFRRADL